MEKSNRTLFWKRRSFSRITRIFFKDIHIGRIFNEIWSGVTTAEVGNKKYLFVKKSLFSNTTLIRDISEGKLIGNITYHSWKTKATILINGDTYICKSVNFWDSKWCLSNQEGVLVDSKIEFSSGVINTKIQDNLLILTGLYIINYYFKIALLLLLIIFPILMK